MISSLRIFKISLRDVDIYPKNFVEINIYEDLLFPGIMGNIVLRDYSALQEINKIKAGDTFKFYWTTGVDETSDKDVIKGEYTIYSDGSLGYDENSEAPTITYNFCSPWLIQAFTRQVSKSYTKKYIHEIVKDLLETVGAVTGTIEESDTMLGNFVSPLWTVPHSIKYLSNKAKSRPFGTPTFFLWTDIVTGKVNWTSLEWFLTNGYGKDNSKLLRMPDNQNYEGRIYKSNTEKTFDLTSMLNQGTYKTQYDVLFFDQNKIITTDLINSKYERTHMATKFPLPKTFGKDSTVDYTSKKTITYYPSNDDAIDEVSFKDIIDLELKRRYDALSMDLIKTNLWVEGNSARRAGYMINMSYPSGDSTLPDNESLSGRYLIRSICHNITPVFYFHGMTIISDGLKVTTDELEEWF